MATGQHLVCVIFVTIGMVFVSGYPTGAPDNWCTRLVPVHGQRGNGDAPYRLIVQSLNGNRQNLKYGTNGHGHLNVTITSRDGTAGVFRGFFLQAIQNGIPLGHQRRQTFGTFNSSSPDAKPVWCESPFGVRESIGGASHTNNRDKSSVSVEWNAPSQNVGPVQLVATVVLNYATYWVDVRSTVIVPDFVNAQATNQAGQGAGTAAQQAAAVRPPTLGGNRIFQRPTNNPVAWLTNVPMWWNRPMPGSRTGVMMTPQQMGLMRMMEQQRLQAGGFVPRFA